MLFVFSNFAIWNVWRVALTQSSRRYFCRLYFYICYSNFLFSPFDLSFCLCYTFFPRCFYVHVCSIVAKVYFFSKSRCSIFVSQNGYISVLLLAQDWKILIKCAFARVAMMWAWRNWMKTTTTMTTTTQLLPLFCRFTVCISQLHWFTSLVELITRALSQGLFLSTKYSIENDHAFSACFTSCCLTSWNLWYFVYVVTLLQLTQPMILLSGFGPG